MNVDGLWSSVGLHVGHLCSHGCQFLDVLLVLRVSGQILIDCSMNFDGFGS